MGAVKYKKLADSEMRRKLTAESPSASHFRVPNSMD
jgi:hypothetical protein